MRSPHLSETAPGRSSGSRSLWSLAWGLPELPDTSTYNPQAVHEFHYYEGIEPHLLALPVRIMKMAGIRTVILTNAAGGLNPDFVPGDLMVITDHINLSGINPLIGGNEDAFGPRFPDMTKAYHPEYCEKIIKEAEEMGIRLRQGIYVMNTGPSYETPAEIRMMRLLGGDAVGMSTVPEVVAARHCGIHVIGISCITNMAPGILDQPLCHDEVIETAEKVKHKFECILDRIIGNIL
ncbi:purine-nucleoside phosphorylase [Schaedlerella arabinosiphila]|uniref:purine-nucleoside phosphorylase n=1 Tax=Schaedlerella arabinosiphila TaxID=2044587 RepID=UPI002F3E6C58